MSLIGNTANLWNKGWDFVQVTIGQNILPVPLVVAAQLKRYFPEVSAYLILKKINLKDFLEEFKIYYNSKTKSNSMDFTSITEGISKIVTNPNIRQGFTNFFNGILKGDIKLGNGAVGANNPQNPVNPAIPPSPNIGGNTQNPAYNNIGSKADSMELVKKVGIFGALAGVLYFIFRKRKKIYSGATRAYTKAKSYKFRKPRFKRWSRKR